MNKKIMFLPLLALVGGVLVSCGGGDEPADDQLDKCKLAPAEFLGHKRATELKDGKSYYLGVCKFNEDDETEKEMMFINGEPHSDKDGTYPYYLSETAVEVQSDFADVAKVKVDYINDTEFTLQILKDGASYDGKYIGVYKGDSSYSNFVFSYYCADEAGDDVMEGRGYEEKDVGKTCIYNFSWCESYEGYAIKTAVLMIADERKEEEEPLPKFMGTDNQYISLDCCQTEKMFGETYNLGYFYEI